MRALLILSVALVLSACGAGVCDTFSACGTCAANANCVWCPGSSNCESLSSSCSNFAASASECAGSGGGGGGTCTTATVSGTCSNPSYPRNCGSGNGCCAASNPFTCPGTTGGCYATASQAAAACPSSCISCR